MMKRLPYKIIEFLGHGQNAAVFKVEYEGQEAAMKVQLGYCRKSAGIRSRTEFDVLKRLEDVKNVPNPIDVLDYLEGTYQELGLDACGLPLEKVVPKLFLRTNSHYFKSALIMELIEGDFVFRPCDVLCDVLYQRVPKELINHPSLDETFINLKSVVGQVHDRKVLLPDDYSVMVKGNKPYLLDLHFSARFDDSFDFTIEKMFERDYRLIEAVRKIIKEEKEKI